MADLTQVWTWTAPGHNIDSVGGLLVSPAGVHVLAPPCGLVTLRTSDGSERWRAFAVPSPFDLYCGLFVATFALEEQFVVGDRLYAAGSVTVLSGPAPGTTSTHDPFTTVFDLSTGETHGHFDTAMHATSAGNAVATDAVMVPETDQIVS